MGILIALTAVAQVFLHNTFKREALGITWATVEPTLRLYTALVDYLPMSLSTKALATRYRGHNPDPKHELGMELFNKEGTCLFLTPEACLLCFRCPGHCST